MAKEFKRYLVTSALPYANGPVHIGHLAGVYIPSDIYTRYLRLRGRDVISVCGSDEHGVPITIKARKEGVTPQQIVDRYHALIKKSFEGLGMSFDIYSRTSSKTHAETASAFFRKLYDEGKFIEKTSMQYYDEEAQTFLADRYIVGTCPKCGNDRAYGDQCEKCGSTLSPDELIDPHSAVSGSVPVKRETKHWYLPLDRYEEFLREWILDGHKEWKTNVYGQCKSWLDGGLQPRAVSRDLDWGIPVPVEGAEGKVLYVWFDAPIGYISATKDLTPDWERYWKSEDTKMVHFIGKDNIVFHCIVFPSMLKAHARKRAGQRVPEPRRRQDFDLAQLGRMAARVPRGVPRQGGCPALCALRQCSGDKGQRLHVEGFPGPQQQRTGGCAGKFRQPGAGADPEILRRQGSGLR